MRKGKYISAGLILAVVAIFILAYTNLTTNKSPLTTEKKHGVSGQSDYLLIYKNSAKLDFAIIRPDVKDTTIYLCTAGAFTRLDDFKIDGLYICNGDIGNRDRINYTLGGGIKIINGEPTIFPTSYGKIINDSMVSEVISKKGSFFQQIRMVDDKGIAKINNDDLTNRRGIVIFKDGKTAIAESVMPVTFSTFESDIAAMGAKGLIYTDMGAWDEGWYRNSNGEVIILGHGRTQTKRQSNWVVFRK
jgi:hypothetical protein